MPSPRRAVLFKVAGSIAAAVLYLSLAKKYPLALLEELTDPTSDVSRSWSGVYLLWYAYLATLVVRCKYYHAWLLSEAICNNSGMGFNGYDKDGKPKWDKMSNVDVFGFEVKDVKALSTRSAGDTVSECGLHYRSDVRRIDSESQ
ncbi:Lysophospholipid acyltransferase 1 [Eumeta japonica]|uniref:Lysophospholipid acyltransferase 1 n=1 Tax=Eumeta variegata TaxID=151549 RepID=A0A4C1VTE7_EUMVA|nr:Lysophospholipid acyltransferase 1 [Eumeta japonica]